MLKKAKESDRVKLLAPTKVSFQNLLPEQTYQSRHTECTLSLFFQLPQKRRKSLNLPSEHTRAPTTNPSLDRAGDKDWWSSSTEVSSSPSIDYSADAQYRRSAATVHVCLVLI